MGVLRVSELVAVVPTYNAAGIRGGGHGHGRGRLHLLVGKRAPGGHAGAHVMSPPVCLPSRDCSSVSKETDVEHFTSSRGQSNTSPSCTIPVLCTDGMKRAGCRQSKCHTCPKGARHVSFPVRRAPGLRQRRLGGLLCAARTGAHPPLPRHAAPGAGARPRPGRAGWARSSSCLLIWSQIHTTDPCNI